MDGLSVKKGDFGTSDHEAKEYEEWISALPKTGGDGFHKRRSSSVPAGELGHHPHIAHILSPPLNYSKWQPLESSRSGNICGVIFDPPEKCLHDLSKLNYKLPTQKDVDSCKPTMRETSSTERKRKKHQHSSDPTLSIRSEDVLSGQSFEEAAVLPSNIEDEGVATSCKRMKLSTLHIKKFHHNNVFESLSSSRNGAEKSVHELGDISERLTWDSDPTSMRIDGESHEQKTINGNGDTNKKKKIGSEFLARYEGPANNLPDYGPPVVPAPIAVATGRNKVMAGEKKTNIPGSFRPFNNLKRGDEVASLLPRPSQKKVFDLHENKSSQVSDEARAIKRQKVGRESSVRRESSGSIVEISGDGNQAGIVRNMSSTSSAPKKIVQSISSRSHYQNQHFASRLGEVDEYNRTEAIVGFAPAKKRKPISSEFEQRSSRDEPKSDSRQYHISLISEAPTFSKKEKRPGSQNGAGQKPILVEDLEPDDVVELGHAPKAPQGMTRTSTPRPAANKFLTSAEKSDYFTKPGALGKVKNGIQPPLVPSDLSGIIAEAGESEKEGSPPSSIDLENAAEEFEDPEEDIVDLLNHDDGLAKLDQKADSRVQINAKIVETFASKKSASISNEGDIPKNTFSSVQARTNRGQRSHTLKSELSFGVTYMQSGQKYLEVSDYCKTWKLQHNSERNEFDIVANDKSLHEIYPGLVLKPGKIHVVKYSNESLKVVISRAMETSIGAAAQVLLKMDRPGDGERLALTLKRLNHTIKLSPMASGQQLDNIFATSLRSAPPLSHQSKDIALLMVKEARRASEHEKMREVLIGSEKPPAEESSQPANTGRLRSSAGEPDGSAQTRRQSIAHRMQPNLLSDACVSSHIAKVVLPIKNELLSTSPPNMLSKEDFYSSRPATRSSSTQWNGEQRFRPHKSRSPSPVRWTAENPSWKEEHSWEASLTFPKQSKKKSTVDARDIERLDEGGFLNDNLVDFYLRYLEDCLERSRPELARRIYFHNTFFYVALTKGKVRSNNINYDAVKRWTSKVDLFSYDYIVVPVCEKLHWYVAIICNAPRLLHPDVPETPTAQETDEQAMLHLKATPSSTPRECNNESEIIEINAFSNDTAEPRSASPSVVAQVEHMSLEDHEQEWPESDALPDVLRARIPHLRSIPTVEEQKTNPIEGEIQNQGQSETTRPKGKKVKRKSLPIVRKYDPSEPRIITLDSLGQAHSPTCSNLKEYLVCEAKERRNVDIAPGRLGMTAKGLPQQSNYCDCGVFVLGYIDKFLENPDEFVYNILQGDIAENKARVEIEASQMRRAIRELLFMLQAEQAQDGKKRLVTKPNANKGSDVEARSRISSNILVSKSESVNGKFSKPAETKPDLKGSDPTEQGMQPIAWSTSKTIRDSKRVNISETRQHSSAATSVHEPGLEGEIEPLSIDPSMAKSPEHFSKSSTPPQIGPEDREVMETPTVNIKYGPIMAAEQLASPDKNHVSPPPPTDGLIPQNSPQHSTSSKGNRLASPHQNEEIGAKTQNTFKQFARSPDSPFQNTRHRSRQGQSHEQIPAEIKDSQDGHRLEVGETPLGQRVREASFEDILELTPESRKSKLLFPGINGSPEPKVTSPSKVLWRKRGGSR